MKPNIYSMGPVVANPVRPEEKCFTSFDGARLVYRYWPEKKSSSVKKAIVLFHRGHEHGGRMAHVPQELNMPEFCFFAWDARGLGLSSGERGYAENFGVLVKDVDSFMCHISNEHGIAMENIAVIAQSVGAVAVSAWVHDYAPKIRCMVLASPAFQVKLYVPFARQGLAVLQKLRGKFFVNSYVKAKFLTHDRHRIGSYTADPLITRPIAVNLLLGLYDTSERVIADAAAIHVPTQLLVSGSDWVVHHAPQHRFIERLGSNVKECHVLAGFYHDTLGEKDRALAFEKIRPFIENQFSRQPCYPDLLEADRRGHTKSEFDRLAAPPGTFLSRLYWKTARLWIGAGAALSTGMKISRQTGFDSGSTLDYVYENRADGKALLGRLVDRIYLDSIGWRGIRQRKVHLEKLINQAVDNLTLAGKRVRIVDIAAGHGRYILEALEKRRQQVDHVLLRDYSQINVDAGRWLIQLKHMDDSARFEKGDAFDRASLAAIQPGPSLAVVSGLYELFPENSQIVNSLNGLADAMEPGSYLIYTGQPWHPQLELIARTLTSHRQGKPWIMRRRTQLEMDQLVELAGFEKIDQLTDEWGIFTVSLARRKQGE